MVLSNKELQECSRDMLYLTQITKDLFQAISCNFTGPVKFNFITLTKYGFLWKKIKTCRKKINLNHDVEAVTIKKKKSALNCSANVVNIFESSP